MNSALKETEFYASFKFCESNEQRASIKPPKCHPKKSISKYDSSGGSGIISFLDTSDLSSSNFSDTSKNESFFDQSFCVVSKIGEGSFGEVFRARKKDDGVDYAVKRIKCAYGSSMYKSGLREAKVHLELSNNENCVKMIMSWHQNTELFMVFELCRESVDDFVHRVKQVPEKVVWSFLRDMLNALKSLHDRNLVHLDVKLENILITYDNRFKLADFGLVCDVNQTRSQPEGDSRYMAPEVLQNEYHLTSDIFSLGLSSLELATNIIMPNSGPVWHGLRRGLIPTNVQGELSPELKSVIISMINPDPLLRPTVYQLVQNEILQRKIDELVNVSETEIFIDSYEEQNSSTENGFTTPKYKHKFLPQISPYSNFVCSTPLKDVSTISFKIDQVSSIYCTPRTSHGKRLAKTNLAERWDDE